MKDYFFDYKEVPVNYTHCLHAKCVYAKRCLRFTAGLHADEKTPLISVINPVYVDNQAEKCRFFQKDEKKRFALGITHLYDNLPHVKAVEIKNILISYFQRSTYYRIRKKERFIRPEHQRYIQELFKENGISEEPVYDKFVYKYDW